MHIQSSIPRRASHARPAASVLIGRSSACDIVLDDWTVSRRHAQILRDGDHWVLEDLGSANGTGVNGEPVVDRVELSEGDFLTFGIVGLRFSVVEAPRLS